MSEEKFGFYRKSADIPKDWRATELLINNNVLRISQNSTYPLVPLTAKKNIVIRYVIYACVELHRENKTRFGYKQLLDKLKSRKSEYDKLILKKIKRITEISMTGNYVRGINYYKTQGKSKDDIIQKKIMKKRMEFEKNAVMKNDDVYYALALLLGTFLELEYKISKSESENFEDKKPNEKYYYLSSEGKKLLGKFYDEKYII